MFNLIGHHAQSKRMLELKNTPRFPRSDLMMRGSEQKQVGQHRDAQRFLTPIAVATDLMFTQTQPRLELPIDDLSGKGLAR
jgi:hypothetical protein